ncbi:MAG: hypothetical protein E5W09_28260, partial [Mesorhizobium sp.]
MIAVLQEQIQLDIPPMNMGSNVMAQAPKSAAKAKSPARAAKATAARKPTTGRSRNAGRTEASSGRPVY